MLCIKDIFKASVCSFCVNIYEYYSLDANDFIEKLRLFFKEKDLQQYLMICTAGIAYDIVNIENVCNSLHLLNNKQFKEDNVIDICKNAYLETIKEDKTINVEAFVDNLAKHFSEFKK